jgi:predicted DNA-binding transcriptional regulator YafY
MRYQQTLEIHQRLATVLRLIGTGRYSTPALAEKVGVSIPTISRIVAALREQGHGIKAERTAKGWRYVLAGGGVHSEAGASSPVYASH